MKEENIMKENYFNPKTILTEVQDVINIIPFKRKRGKWILIGYLHEQTYMCSCCGEIWTFIKGTPFDNRAFYCPSCGARMKEGEQNE